MSLVGIQFKFPKWEQKLKRAHEEINLFLAADMQTNRGMLFDAEGGRNGHQKWAPLVFRNGMILAKRGTLRKSIAPKNDGRRPGAGPDGIVRFSGATITVGTSLFYARIMNDGTAKLPGGVIRAKHAKALKIPVDSSFLKSQKIRKGLLEEDLGNEEGMKRKASLERRIVRIQRLLSESKSASSRRKQQAYLTKLNAQLRASKDRKEIEELARRKNRVEGSKGNFIFRKSVRIKARPFDTWTDQDQNELELALRNKLVEILNR